MKEFDINNSLIPELIFSALIRVENEIFMVANMNKFSVLLENNKGDKRVIYNNKDWSYILLNDIWLSKFGLSESSLIRNNRTQTDWKIRKTNSRLFYVTIERDFSLGENPTIPLNSVHMLQLWYQLLSDTYLSIDNVFN